MVGPAQDEDGDGNVQIGGDGIVAAGVTGSTVAGGNITQIIQGVNPAEHAEALAQIAILKERLKITESAMEETPTQDESLAADDAIEAAYELEVMGAVIDPWDCIRLGKAATIRSSYRTAEFYFESSLSTFQDNNDLEGQAQSMDYLGRVFRHLGKDEEARDCMIRRWKYSDNRQSQG